MEFRDALEPDARSGAGAAAGSCHPSASKRLGRRPTPTATASVEAASPWLYHHLTISGPAAVVSILCRSRAGIGHRSLGGSRPPASRRTSSTSRRHNRARSAQLTIAGCRILARQFRETGPRTALRGPRPGSAAAAPVPSTSTPCCRCRPQSWNSGPTHPAGPGLACDRTGASPTRPRQVTERPHGAKCGAAAAEPVKRVVGYSFFTAGETPHAAIRAAWQPRWPALRFVLRPRPLD